MKRLLCICFFVAGFGFASKAQIDPHFSQYFVFPTWVNPAFTGAFDGDYRIAAVYRSQWSDIQGGFRTVGLAADAVTDKNLNVGLNIFQQTTGTGYNYQNAFASFAYNGVRFGEENMQMVTFGIQAGFLSRRFDASKFKTEDQWNNITGYVPGTPTTDLLKANSSLVFDAAAGLMYCNMDPNAKVNPYIGFSVSHLTQPEDNFLSSTIKTKVPRRFTGHASFGIYVNEEVTVTPTFLYSKQGSADEKMVGAYADAKVADNVSLIGGANYRFNDAVVPFLGLQSGNAKFGISYDVTHSEIGRTLSASNSYEMSLTYVFKNGNYKYLNCPKF